MTLPFLWVFLFCFGFLGCVGLVFGCLGCFGFIFFFAFYNLNWPITTVLERKDSTNVSPNPVQVSLLI